MTMDTILALYQHGALIPAGIYALYLGLKWSSTRFALLEVPNRAHYISVFLGALAVLAIPASQGTTPNLSMIVGAVVTALSLLAPGLSSSPPSPPAAAKGSTRLGIMIALAGISVWLAVCDVAGCAAIQKMTGAWAACAKQDLGQLVEGVPLSQVVADLIDKNTADLETQAENLIVKVGVDAYDCAVVAYEQTHPAAPTATPATSTPAPSGLSRVKAVSVRYRAAHK